MRMPTLYAALSRLAAEGWHVVTYDAHGHGRSGPKGPKHRAVVVDFQDLVDDYLHVADK